MQKHRQKKKKANQIFLCFGQLIILNPIDEKRKNQENDKFFFSDIIHTVKKPDKANGRKQQGNIEQSDFLQSDNSEKGIKEKCDNDKLHRIYQKMQV